MSKIGLKAIHRITARMVVLLAVALVAISAFLPEIQPDSLATYSSGRFVPMRSSVVSGSPSWKILPTPNPDNTYEALNGISCVTTTFCMAVGTLGLDSGTLTELWNGSTWKLVPRPNPPGGVPGGGSLLGVSCTSTTFCMAVGGIYNVSSSSVNSIGGFAEIWSGSSWRLIKTPQSSYAITSVSCVSPNFCVDGNGDIWNGTSWKSYGNQFSDGEPSGTSCVSPSFCMVVAGNIANYWNGSSWKTLTILGGQYSQIANFTGVSCINTSFCMAVGDFVNFYEPGSSNNFNFAATWNGSSWNPTGVTGINQEVVLKDTSCITTSFCMAGGYSLNTVDVFYLTKQGTKWSLGWDGVPVLGYINSVSCLSLSFCMASGGNTYSWGAPSTTLVEYINPGTGNSNVSPTPNPTYGGFLTGVSCTASSFCMVEGYDGAIDSFIGSWNGSSWKVKVYPYSSGEGTNSISCTSPDFCMDGFATIWDGSSWSWAGKPPQQLQQLSPKTTFVSCVSQTFCAVVGVIYNTVSTIPPIPLGTFAASWNGSTLTPVSSPSPTGPDDALNGVSCVKTNFCMAVGSELTGTATLIEAFNGSTWTVMPSPTPKGGGTLSSVSCAATNFCMATGSGTKDNPFMEYYDGYNWTIISSPTLTDGGTLSSISCPEISSCVAVGELNTGYDSVATLVEDFNGIKWSIVPSPNPIYGGDLTSVSCPSLSFCMATGTGDVVYSLGETGYAPTPVVPSVTSISPNAGSSSGGTVVTIKGSDLAATTAVDFGGTPALSFHAISEFELTAVAPTKLPGTVPVSVVTPYGTSTTTPGCANSFTYGDNPPSPSPGSYTPITPFRAADTRPNSGKPYAGKTLSSCGTLDIQLSGIPGSNVPSGGVSAIVADITAVDPSASGYLSVYPASSIRPVVSNLNFNAHTTVAGLIEVPLSSSGEIAIYNGSGGSTNVVVDVEGYIGTTGDLYNPIDPLRICDTRPGNPSNLQGQESQCNSKTLSPNTPLSVQVAGIADIPLSAVAAVVNITVADSSGGGYVTVYPASSTPPVSSNVNFTKGELISNRAVVGLSPSGKIDIISNTSTDVIVDIAGYYSASGSSYNPLLPARIADSRCDTTSPPSYCPSENLPSTNMSFFALGPGSQENLTVAGIDSVPLSATAVVLNVTVTSTTRASYLTLWPSGTPRPVASDLNWQPGTTIANLVVADVGKNGQVSLYNNGGSTEVIVDIEGYYG